MNYDVLFVCARFALLFTAWADTAGVVGGQGKGLSTFFPHINPRLIKVTYIIFYFTKFVFGYFFSRCILRYQLRLCFSKLYIVLFELSA